MSANSWHFHNGSAMDLVTLDPYMPEGWVLADGKVYSRSQAPHPQTRFYAMLLAMHAAPEADLAQAQRDRFQVRWTVGHE